LPYYKLKNVIIVHAITTLTTIFTTPMILLFSCSKYPLNIRLDPNNTAHLQKLPNDHVNGPYSDINVPYFTNITLPIHPLMK